MSQTYRVAEFARLAGVTVRTLQYYDRIGLLRPSRSTEGGQRLYARRDLLRLQQILTLKWMGLRLEAIKAVLESPRYDLRATLRLQKEAIDAQIAELQRASVALSDALGNPELEAGMLDGQRIAAIIRAMTTHPEERWARGFYSDDAWAGIASRRMAYTAEDFARFTRDWQELTDQFEELRHLPPDHPAIQRLAATMAGYLEIFTAGDAETAAGLRQLRSAEGAIPAAYQMADPELARLMGDALAHFWRTTRSPR
jgi:MerR family transcriptional regulator, thiopeptide resistance regulator